MSHQKILKKVKNLEEALHCKVCEKLLEDPLLIKNCGHTTCKKCFDAQLTKICPLCNVSVKNLSLIEDKQLKDLLLHLKCLKSILQNGTSLSDVDLGKENESNGNEVQVAGPICSTPKALNTVSPVELPSPATSTCEKSIILETPENQVQNTPVPSNQRRRSGIKKVSSSTSSPNTSAAQSPVTNINKKNHKGETLLHRAVIKGDITKVTNLLNEGAEVNTQDNNGWTPLHEASNHGFVEIAKLLLDHGALVNVPSLKDNITPLHDCLLNYRIPIAILLVSRGADLLSKTSFGYTALDLCKTDEDRRTLTEACSPFIEANTIISDTKMILKSDKLVFLASNLNENQKQQLQKCAQMLKADITDDFKPEVTHIVTSCDNMGNCMRTMKVLLGVLSGIWIMNYQWLEVCLEYKKKVEEEVFEVQGTKIQPNVLGPKRGRLNREQKFPPLFDGFFFYLHGSFTKPTPDREELCNLINLGGGKILNREPRADTVASNGFLIPYHASGTALENTSHVILFQDKPPRDTHLHSGHIVTTQVMWLIACISEFKLLELRQASAGNK